MTDKEQAREKIGHELDYAGDKWVRVDIAQELVDVVAAKDAEIARLTQERDEAIKAVDRTAKFIERQTADRSSFWDRATRAEAELERARAALASLTQDGAQKGKDGSSST